MKNFLFILFISLTTMTLQAKSQGDVEVVVNGLVCDFCAQALNKTFRKQPAIKDIDVNLETKIVTLYYQPELSLNEATIRQLITDSGYNIEAIHYVR